GASLDEGFLNQVCGVGDALFHLGVGKVDQAVHAHLGADKILTEAVVKLAGNTAALGILHLHQLKCEATKVLFRTLEFMVHAFELTSFAMQLGEDTDPGEKEFGDHGDGNVVDGAPLVALEFVEVGEMNRGDEDDRRALKTRMLTDQVGELKA